MQQQQKQGIPQETAKGASTFIKGAAILGVAAIIIKVMGAVFRIPLANWIGDDGMGYYQTAYPIYNFVLVVSTAGIPTAIAKIISEKLAVGDVHGADRVFNITFWLMTVVGTVMTALIILGARPLVHFLHNEQAYLSLIAIAPAVMFVSMMAVYRGYFQGRQSMQAYAMSQLVEQFVRVALGLSLAFMLAKTSIEYASAGATFGASAGGFFGLIIIMLMHMRHKKRNVIPQTGTHGVETVPEVVKNLLIVAIPITIGASIMPVMTLFDLGIVLRRLVDVGFTTVQANELYGQLTGYAQTLVNLPQVLTAAIQISIVPAVAHFVVLNDKKQTDHTIETGLRLALIIGLPCAVGLSILAEPIMRLLYPMQLDIAENTGAILAILGIGIVFLSMFQVTTGILQGLGKQKVPAYNLMAGAVVKMVLSYVLVGMPSLHIMGAAWSTVIAFAFAAVLNHFALVKHARMHIDYVHIFLKPIIDVAVMAVAVIGAHMMFNKVLSPSLATASAIAVGGLVFLLMLLVTRTLTDEDLNLLPGGAKLRKLQNKLTRR